MYVDVADVGFAEHCRRLFLHIYYNVDAALPYLDMNNSGCFYIINYMQIQQGQGHTLDIKLFLHYNIYVDTALTS